MIQAVYNISVSLILLILLISSSCSTYKDQVSYMELRNKSLQDEARKSISHSIKLTSQEQRLNKILSDLQQERLDHYKKTHFFPPARNFYVSKEHVEETELFKILQKMPKGGMHHIHSTAMGDLDWVIDRAIDLDEMYIYWSDDIPVKKGTLHAYQVDEQPQGYYAAKEILTSKEDLQEFKSYFLFDKTFDRDSTDIWSKFESIFGRLDGFVNYEKVFEDYLVHSFELLTEDGIQHVELRMPFENYTYGVNRNADLSNIEPFVAQVRSAVNRVKINYPDFTIKIIHANLRFRPNEDIWKDMQNMVTWRQLYPDLLIGYDLVAEEDAGHTTLYHLESFLKLEEANKQVKHPLELYLHDGESVWVDNDNLYEAILLGSKRIGHGFNLFRYPDLMQEAKKRKICIEVNPLSNQILGYLRDLRLHPAYTYLKSGVDISISSDDPLIFDYEGLSYDYWHIYMAWQLDLKDLKKLSMNGILFSALEADEKTKALNSWQERWDAFIDNTLSQYSTL